MRTDVGPIRVDDVIRSVCRLAVDHINGTDSVCGLLDRSGYGRFKGSISATDLERCLHDNPDWVDAWFQFSEDKRTDGWLIGKTDSGFAVAYYSERRREGPFVFEDRLRATSEYLVRELDDSQRVCRSWKSRVAGAVLWILGDRGSG